MANDKNVNYWLKKFSLEEALDDAEKFKTAAVRVKEKYTPIAPVDFDPK